MQYIHNTKGKTCTNSIIVDLDKENRIQDLTFTGGGCKGNLAAIRGILLGKPATWVIDQFSGIPCGNKGTSCANELALCLKNALEGQNSPSCQTCAFYTGEEIGIGRHECLLLNDICENHLECVYRTDVSKYNELKEKSKNFANIIL